MQREKLDVEKVRREFPIFARRLHDHPLVYLDSAATTQKPRAVIHSLARFYAESNASIHRGVHTLAAEATSAYEASREKVQRFLGAGDPREIVFTRGTTESINLVASSLSRRLAPGDEILVSELEHHSNIVPWQLACERTGAILRVIPVTEAGDLDLDRLATLVGPRTRVVAVTHVSNAIGTVTPIAEISAIAHRAREDAFVVVDGAQAVPHLRVDVRSLNCDFYAFSGHKLYGPTGIGALYGRLAVLDDLPPYQGGGDMILSVSFEGTKYRPPPHRFEAGTPAIAEAIGLGAAIDWIESLGREAIAAHEASLLAHADRALASAPGVTLVGSPSVSAGVRSFLVDGIHPHDLGTVLDRRGIAIRTGHHCAQPLLARYHIPATARLSVGAYTTVEEIDALVAGIAAAREVFG
jgi:cysteine desulfurase/selenocysteine lyase